MERDNFLGAIILDGSCLGGSCHGAVVVVIIWGLIVHGAIITIIQGLTVLEPKLILKYSFTGNFLSSILVSDWLIFCCGNLIFHQKSHENDKNTFFDEK